MIIRLTTALCILLNLACTRNEVAARVGDYELTQKDVDYRNQLIRIYFPDEKRDLGLDQLVRAYTYGQILKNNGREITEAIIKGEEERIDKNTAAPEALAKIKKIFGSDGAAYRKVFVFPTYAERTIYFDYFLKNRDLHEATRKPAQDFLARALQSPKKFPFGVNSANTRVSPSLGVLPIHPQEGLVANHSGVPPRVRQHFEQGNLDLAKRWIDEVIKPLKPGQVFSKVIEMDDHWLVMRYNGRLQKDYEVESVRFPKRNYDAWLKEESQKVRVNFLRAKGNTAQSASSQSGSVPQ